jgi:phospholipid-binding lipoprotein MlaA
MRMMRAMAALTLLALTAACTMPAPGAISEDGVFDPYEAQNRRVHAFNRSLDEKLLGGNSGGAGPKMGPGTSQAVIQFADTVAIPQTVVNQLLQFRLWRATKNTLRFTMNATLGLGILDPAAEIGLTEDSSDFGETLAVWGLPEGAFLELPVIGPSTERDAVGVAVDLFTDPLSYVLPSPEKHLKTVARAAGKVAERQAFSDTVDSVLYESADSYAQTRLYYLQNRRFDLGQDAPEQSDIDPLALDVSGF